MSIKSLLRLRKFVISSVVQRAHLDQVIVIGFAVVMLVDGIFAQRPVVVSQTSLQLLDEFGSGLGSEERSARFDVLFSELGFYEESRKNSPAIGYVFVYCGKVCKYGEAEAHIRGIELKMRAREVPRSRMRIVAAGYREKFTIQLWTASDDRAAPVPEPTLNIKHVTFTKLGRRIVEPYDCCDSPNSLWKVFKP